MTVQQLIAGRSPYPPPRSGLWYDFRLVVISVPGNDLDSLIEFLGRLRPCGGAAYIVAFRRSPLTMADLGRLQSTPSQIPLCILADATPIQANHIYIVPMYLSVRVENGRIYVQRTGPWPAVTTVDACFESVARDAGPMVIGVVLGYSEPSSAEGLRAVKASGGITMIQQNPEQETSAVANLLLSGLVDYVMPVEQIHAAVAEYVNGREPNTSADPEAVIRVNEIIAGLDPRAASLLRNFTPVNLMQSVAGACRHTTPLEASDVIRLMRDLVGHETTFFPQSRLWLHLEAHLAPAIVQEKAALGLIRIWMPFCGTGEAAFSLAMLLLERIEKLPTACSIRIFATDIDDEALRIARRGVFEPGSHVSAPRLQRFFIPMSENWYAVNKTLRDAVVFASHDFFFDPFFAKLDLLFARDLFAKCKPEISRGLLARIHAALNERGFVACGGPPAAAWAHLYRAASKKWSIYQRVSDCREPQASPADLGPTPPEVLAARRGSGRESAVLAEDLLLREYTPPALVVNRRGEVQHHHGRTFDLMRPAASRNMALTQLLDSDLGGVVQRTLNRAAATNQSVQARGARVPLDGRHVHLRVTVRPLGGPLPTGLFLVVFEPAETGTAAPAEDHPLVHSLQKELHAAREELHRMALTLHRVTAELQVAHEENIATSEELRTAEENFSMALESQHVRHDELAKINSQLRTNVLELGRVHDDTSNLLRNSDAAIVFLDREFCIRYFTKSAGRLLGLDQEHLGKSWFDVSSRIGDETFLDDAHRVFEGLAPCECQIYQESLGWWLRRIALYRTQEEQIDGFVISYVDVTQLKQAAERDRLLATILVNTQDAVIVHDFEGRISVWNQAAERVYGYTAAEAAHLKAADLVPHSMRSFYAATLQRGRAGEKIATAELKRLRKDGRVIDVSISATVLHDDQGRARAIASTERDITDRKALEREILEIAAAEQVRIGQDLHDSVGQELTGLGLLAECLVSTLQVGEMVDVSLAHKMSSGISRTLKQVRALSHAQLPVEIGAEGLMAAIEDFASRITEQTGVHCRFGSPGPAAVDNNFTATHLFRIAQEAVSNALRHGKPKNITITLSAYRGRMVLSVADDGGGIPDQALSKEGMGLKIMRYRAGLINGELEVNSERGKGTQVVCSLMVHEETTPRLGIEDRHEIDRRHDRFAI